MPSLSTVSLVVPCFNEGANIATFIASLASLTGSSEFRYEVVFVDDGSTDGTVDIIKMATSRLKFARVSLIIFSRNFGKEAALTAGLECAIGDVVIPMDADLQDPPALIPDMLRLWSQGYEVVNAVRLRRTGESLFKRSTAFLYYRILKTLSSSPIFLDTGDFRLLDRAVVSAVLSLPERNRYMKGLFSWVGFKQGFLYYERSSGLRSESRQPFFKLLSLALEGVASFSRFPLQLVTVLGFLLCVSSFGYAAILVARSLFWGVDVPGYTSLMTAILVMGGIQLLSLGVIGEYVGRTFEESKRRPLYLVRENWVSDLSENL